MTNLTINLKNNTELVLNIIVENMGRLNVEPRDSKVRDVIMKLTLLLSFRMFLTNTGYIVKCHPERHSSGGLDDESG